MNIFSNFYSFFVRNVPLYGEKICYSEKTKKLRIRIAILSVIKEKFGQELVNNGSLKRNKFIPLTPQKKDEIRIRIKILSKRIEKLKQKIEREGTKSSITIIGQIVGTLSNLLWPGSGICIAGTTALVKTTYHNSQAATLEEPQKTMAIEVGRALTSSLASKHLSGFAKELLP